VPAEAAARLVQAAKEVGGNARELDFRGAVLRGLNLTGPVLDGADFQGATCVELVLNGCSLECTKFDEASVLIEGFEPPEDNTSEGWARWASEESGRKQTGVVRACRACGSRERRLAIARCRG
jgi:hypothetical protein